MSIPIVIQSVVVNASGQALATGTVNGGATVQAVLDTAQLQSMTVAQMQIAIALKLAQAAGATFPVAVLAGTVNI